MQDPIFETKTETKKKDYAKFIISPLNQGFGNTIGNSLRRVLLGSLPGAAITKIKISGVKHQFSTVKGMKEDVVELILNLKKVRMEFNGNKPAVAKLSVTKAGEVKAGNIETPAGVKIANPDLVLANLSKGGKLEVKITIEAGMGYSPAEDRATGEIGMIPMDATFSPIKRVNYSVEETRVGRLTNYDKLNLEIWTDGSITPKDAIKQASKTLVSYYQQIVTPKKIQKTDKAESTTPSLGAVGNLSVEEIGLPTRIANALLKSGYESIEELSKADPEKLAKVRNLGEKSVKIIKAALIEKGVEMQGKLKEEK